MHLLVTNDDGVRAPGLLALVRELRSVAEVTVLAPDRNWSASGHVKTMHRPLRVAEAELADGTLALATDGAPSDCVALAVLGLVEKPIDMVISGINPTANIGHDVTYSGTVTAAMEAAINGLANMAISLDVPDEHPGAVDFEPAARTARFLATQLLDRDPLDGIVLSVNIPYGPQQSYGGIAVTRQGLRLYRDALVRRRDPRGRAYYWIGGDTPTAVEEPGTDYWALSQGLVSVTPLQLDLTAHQVVRELDSLTLQVEGDGDDPV